SPAKTGLPPRPPFPGLGREFVDLYGSLGDTSHYLFRFGFGGMRERIERSDVLLVGSSHVAFGLSAEQLSRSLSERKGRPIRVYNMGTQQGEGSRFAAEALARGGIGGKAVVLDLFHFELFPAMTGFANRVLRSDRLVGAVAVGQIETGFARDWLLDPWPCIRVERDGRVRVARRLDYTLVRSLDSGDTVYFWAPDRGFLFPTAAKTWVIDPEDAGAWTMLANRGLSLAPGTVDRLKQRHDALFATVIPYPGSARATLPALPCPLLPLRNEGLRTFDGSHLTPEGRRQATEELAERLAPLLP
ncbi:MAG TPA: hypothetical protein VIM58_09255, partial [Candidatus Methylacidiphilales bacterium]